MLKRIFQQSAVDKNSRKKFIPFVNERNFMGSLISGIPKTAAKDQKRKENRDMELIQNLKKTTKEYLFDKKYKKMAEKLRKIQVETHLKDHNYDEEVALCLQTLTQNGFGIKREQDQKNYVEFRQELQEKMTLLRTNVLTSIRVKRQLGKKKKNNKNCKTLQLSQQFEEQLKIKQTRFSSTRNLGSQSQEPKIKQGIFKEIGSKSKFMADVTNHNLKFRELVDTKKINPWKRWYNKEQIELFPGSKLTMTKLQKSIY